MVKLWRWLAVGVGLCSYCFLGCKERNVTLEKREREMERSIDKREEDERERE